MSLDHGGPQTFFQGSKNILFAQKALFSSKKFENILFWGFYCLACNLAKITSRRLSAWFLYPSRFAIWCRSAMISLRTSMLEFWHRESKTVWTKRRISGSWHFSATWVHKGKILSIIPIMTVRRGGGKIRALQHSMGNFRLFVFFCKKYGFSSPVLPRKKSVTPTIGTSLRIQPLNTEGVWVIQESSLDHVTVYTSDFRTVEKCGSLHLPSKFT